MDSLRNQLSRQFQLLESLQNHLSGQFQLLESGRHQLFKQVQLIDRPRSQLSQQIQLIVSEINCLNNFNYSTRQSLTSLARTNPINRQLLDSAVGAMFYS